MSASCPGNMRGPRVKTPLLLLLLLLTTLTGTVLCQDEAEYEDPNPDAGDKEELPPESEAPPISTPSPTASSDGQVEDDAEGSTGDLSLTDPGISDVILPNTTGHDLFLDYATGTVDPSITSTVPVDECLSPIIILVPVVLVVVIIGIIVCCIFLKRRWKQKAESQDLRKEDPYLDGPDTEKVPMPMFEEDVPSVMELEMEELDQWMKKDGEAAEDSKQA
ncbi:transmembrane protein 154 isoform X1 [Scomber scombrus]|uniref:transmembrane protein 154 isoform X1 n=1 Tax=Scomber scombrus TaxID=13677 RepID=UPI002DD9B30F|nr:transmembrane protein 154 isoform X1 [Scomber scombrus]